MTTHDMFDFAAAETGLTSSDPMGIIRILVALRGSGMIDEPIDGIHVAAGDFGGDAIF